MGLNVKNVKEEIPPDTLALDLSYNEIANIEPLTNLPNLYILNLKGNNIN